MADLMNVVLSRVNYLNPRKGTETFFLLGDFL